MVRLRWFGSHEALLPVALVFVTSLAGCSLINAPDDIIVGSGGSDGEGGGPTGGGGGGPPTCAEDDDCAELTNECGTASCGPEGTCVVDPQPAGTECGPALASSCDLQDTCDGDGTCVATHLTNGTFCEDCAAGPGMCALCADGACNDCDTRATEKSFRSPLSASGWVLTGGWALYAQTPPAALDLFAPPECNNGFDDDGDLFVDYPDDPGCSSATDYYESEGFAQCSDGADNDGYNLFGDGFIDLSDPDCESAVDDEEDFADPIVFDHPVLGTDGNRRYPYGEYQSIERETSSATSPPTVLPANLEFRSWHLDEGFAYDLKAVQVSNDGQSFTNVAICPQNQTSPYIFCQPTVSRTADQWDDVSLPVPAEFVGDIGYVRFVYDSTDACCHFERGWYIDALNFAQDCACTDNAECGFLDSGCSTGACSATGECNPAAQNVGGACTLPGSSEGCSEPSCDDNGWCAANSVPFEADVCDTCTDTGFCDICMAGGCLDCPERQTMDNFNTSLWVFTGDWVPYEDCLDPNQYAPNQFDCFSSIVTEPGDPHRYPMIGNDGSRTNVSPWTFSASEIETSSFLTGPTTIPDALRFNSWHQDRGGNQDFNARDLKTIRVSTDGGANWQTVLNCTGNATVAFCQPYAVGTNRALDDWDEIEIDLEDDLVGQTGIFEFFYDTVDAGQGWERGWFIDDLNINRCDQFRTPWPLPPGLTTLEF